MRIITPAEVAKQAGNKYLGVLVAAKFARYLNEFPKDQLVTAGEKLTTKSMQALVDGELNYKLVRRRRTEEHATLSHRHCALLVEQSVAIHLVQGREQRRGHGPVARGRICHHRPDGELMRGVQDPAEDLGTDQQAYLYCAAYGDGKFIVRGMGPAPFQMNGRGTPDPAVNKAAAVGQPVEQDIAMSVKGDKVSCSINNKEVWSAAKSDLVTAGKLKSSDGVFGLRSAHNTEVFVTGLKITKN